MKRELGGANMLRALIGAVCLGFSWVSMAHAQSIDVARFVDPVTARSADLSPDGQHIAFIRRTPQGQEIVVASASATEARVLDSIRNDFGRVGWVAWKGNDRVLAGVEAYVGRGIGVQRGPGFSIYRVISISRDGNTFVQMFEGRTRQLAWGYGSTLLLDTLPNDPGHVLLTAADNLGIGVWRADIASGRVERVADGTWDTRSYTTDGAGYPVMRLDSLPTGGYRVLRRASGESRWTAVMDVRGDLLRSNSPDFDAIGPGPGANQVYVFARLDQQDLGAMYLYDTSTGRFGEPVYASAEADATELWIHPNSRQVIAGCAFAKRLSCQARTPALQRHMNAVNSFFGDAATVSLINLSDDATKWLLHVESPTAAAGYFVYDMTHHTVTPFAALFPSLDLSLLSPTQVVDYHARDGATLWSYVTTRPGGGRRPMVVMPHGGPESRDEFGYDAFVQFLAAHGYVVLQPNFRGSGGFGRAFADAGRGQWGLRMQDDITDAVRHMIDTGVADPARICIVGGSYGGYAALAGVALTPELYRCAISVAGISDLPTVLRTERSVNGERSRSFEYWRRSIGDLGANGVALVAASPARQAAHITAPVLLIHGEDDQNVPIVQSELMERALRSAGRPTRLVRLRGADHYWDSWTVENRTILFRETETFLAQYLH